MKTLKLRAFQDNKMYYQKKIGIYGTKQFLDSLYEDCNLMEHTGLSDKQGVDIYEGDIITTQTSKNMVISWSDKFASFCINRDGWAFQHWFGEACNPEHCEVIGNIYENPELLKQ